jgi:spermidine/putrescine transport system permease protein
MASRGAAGTVAGVSARPEPIERTRPRGSLWQRFTRTVDRWLLPAYVVLAVAYLALPVLVMIAFSFNDGGRSNLTWRGFTLDAWFNPLGRPGLSDAVLNSMIVAFLATLISTILGVLIGLALVRHSFRGRSATNLLIFLPMATPEIVLGTSLLTLFLQMHGLFYPLGVHTVLIAHVMFCISFVVVTIKARLQGFPRHLEEAAMDLGANEWTTFWRVTFPLILPGVIAAAMLAFSLSIDDYVVTSFTAGQTSTFPLFIYGSQQRGIPVQVNVIGTIIFVSAVGLVALSTILSRQQRPDPVDASAPEEIES